MTTSLHSATKAAADEIACCVSLTGQHAEVYSEIISRHVEPIVRAVEEDRDSHQRVAMEALANLAAREAEANGLRAQLADIVNAGSAAQDEANRLRAQLADMTNAAASDLAKLAEVEESRAKETNVTRDAMELMYAAEKRAQKYMHERDSALTRADSAEALLREADNRLRGLIRIVENELPTGTCKDDAAFCSRITSHFATATTKEGKK